MVNGVSPSFVSCSALPLSLVLLLFKPFEAPDVTDVTPGLFFTHRLRSATPKLELA
jgi:hypothetical protein